jgi:hypothetical protein|uniref:Uncharacterized protein n=1 Tax=viral metagenome TaxID=1070528 RepID=A0A6C0BKB6_9ZZZZ
MFLEFFQTPIGIIILSVIWGLGLSTLFRKACQGRHCQVLVYQGPDPKEIADTYYNYGTDACYQYIPVISTCDG